MKCFSFHIRQTLCPAQVARIRQEAAQTSWEGFLQSRRRVFVFLTEVSTSGLSGQVMQHSQGCRPGDAGTAVQAFLCAWCLKPGSETVQQVEEDRCRKAMFKAFCQGLVRETDQVLEAFGSLGARGDFINRKPLTADLPMEALHQKAQGFSFLPELAKELRRIGQTANHPGVMGHPVHYLLVMERDSGQEEVIHLLLSALYAAKRIQRSRYHILGSWKAEHHPLNFLARAGRHSAGSALVLDFVSGQREEEEGPDRLDLIAAMDAVQRFHQEVLFIICLAPEDKESLDQIRKHLPHVPFLLMQQADLGREAAEAYLKKLANEDGATADDTLFAKLAQAKPGLSKLILQEQYQDWYRDYLRSCAYPQYAGLQALLQPSETLVQEAGKDCKPCRAYDTLDKMIGLQQAKAAIHRMLAAHRAGKLYEAHGLTRQSPAMHMMFTGNPGTAKTTVARLYAQILKDHGLLDRGELVEVSRSDLVGKYVGWTARLVKDCFKRAAGSVLFIDEAYALACERSGGFGEEAINALVLEMENRREDTLVILAGYPREMEQLMQTNPGLRSRIGFHIHFEDYSPGEMSQILHVMAQERGITLGEGVLERVHPWFFQSGQQITSGNGRLVRNLLDKAQMKQAERLLSMPPEAFTEHCVRTLMPEDFEQPEALTAIPQTIGFQ